MDRYLQEERRAEDLRRRGIPCELRLVSDWSLVTNPSGSVRKIRFSLIRMVTRVSLHLSSSYSFTTRRRFDSREEGKVIWNKGISRYVSDKYDHCQMLPSLNGQRVIR
jgi:hypothetical protein